MKLYRSDTHQKRGNVFYPIECDILATEELEAAAEWDHVGAHFRDDHRGDANFICADVILLDIDNGAKDGPEVLPEDWKTPEDVQAAFSGVMFWAIPSKNHMKQKGAGKGDHYHNLTPRPKFHFYFPLAQEVTDAAEYAHMKAAAMAHFPFFDPDALDASRYLDGVKGARATYYGGNVCLDEWLEMHAAEDQDDGQTEIEPLPDAQTAGSGPLPKAAQTAPRSGAMKWDDVINDDNTEWTAFYAELRRRIPCSDFLTPSPRAGRSFYICPFCHSGEGPHKTGTLKVFSDNSWTCYKKTCSDNPDRRRGGDVITLYRDLHNLPDNWTAAKELADLYHIDRPGRQDTATQPTERPTAPTPDAGGTKPTQDDAGATQTPTAAQGDIQAPTADTAAIQADIDAWTDDRSRGADMIKRMGFTMETAEAFNFGYSGAFYFADFPEEALPAIILTYPGEIYYIAINGSFTETPTEYAPLFNPLALDTGGPCFVCGSPADALAIIQAGGVACAVGGMQPEAARQALDGHALLVCGKALAAKLDGVKFDIVDLNPAQQLKDDPEGLARAIRAATGQRDILADFLTITNTRQFEPISTGLPGLDAKLDGGLISQTLNIIGAAPAQGKTVLATQILESMARAGRPCLYVNLEMSRDQLLARSLARICAQRLNVALPATRILQGYSLTPAQRKAVEQAANIYRDELQGMHYMDGPAAVTGLLDTIRKAATTAKATGRPAPNICIDYLQITQGEQREDTKDRLQRLLLGLKDYARQNNAIVLAITAQNRIANADGKPSMAAGRDTSALEYSADTFLQLNPGTGGILDLYVVKNRFGRADETPLSLYLEGGVTVAEWLQEPTGANHKAL